MSSNSWSLTALRVRGQVTVYHDVSRPRIVLNLKIHPARQLLNYRPWSRSPGPGGEFPTHTRFVMFQLNPDFVSGLVIIESNFFVVLSLHLLLRQPKLRDNVLLLI